MRVRCIYAARYHLGNGTLALPGVHAELTASHS